MAEKARLFQDHLAEEPIMSSPDPSAHKRIGRSVRSFNNAVWDRLREDVVLAGNFAKLCCILSQSRGSFNVSIRFG